MMARIACSECGHETTEQAKFCSQCGARQKAAQDMQEQAVPAGPPSQTGSRGYSWHAILSLALIFIGIAWGLVEFNGLDQQTPSIMPLVLLLIGFIWYVLNRLRLWRRNE